MLEFPLYVSWLTEAPSLNISGGGEGLTPSPSLPTPWFQCSESVPQWVKYGLIENPKVKLVCVCVCVCECTLKGLEGYTLNLNVIPYRQVNRQASKIWKCDEAKREALYSLCSCIV